MSKPVSPPVYVNVPPRPEHAFDTSINWQEITAEIPIFDSTSKPFWTRLNRYCNYIQPMCKFCYQAWLEHITAYGGSSHDTMIPIQECLCAKIAPKDHPLPIPQNLDSKLITPSLMAHSNAPEFFLHLPKHCTPHTLLEDMATQAIYPFGDPVYLDDYKGIPQFSPGSFQIPDDGPHAYLSSALNIFSMIHPLLPHDVELQHVTTPVALIFYNLVDHRFQFDSKQDAYSNDNFTNNMVLYPDTDQLREHNQNILKQNLNQVFQMSYNIYSNVKEIHKICKKLYECALKILPKIPIEWLHLQCYSHILLEPWSKMYHKTIDAAVAKLKDMHTQLENLSSNFYKANTLQEFTQQLLPLRTHLQDIFQHTAHPFEYVDLTFKQLRTDIIQHTSVVAHFFARVSRLYPLAAHAYASAYHASVDQRINRLYLSNASSSSSDSSSLSDSSKENHPPVEGIRKAIELIKPLSPSPRTSLFKALSLRETQDSTDTTDDIEHSDNEPSNEAETPYITVSALLKSIEQAEALDLSMRPTTPATSPMSPTGTTVAKFSQAGKTIHSMKVHHLGLRNFSYSPGTCAPTDITRRNPHINFLDSNFTDGYDWSKTFYPLSVPLHLLQPTLNSGYPKLPPEPPASFMPLEPHGFRQEQWNHLTQELGNLVSMPQVTTCAIRRQIAEVSLKKSNDADEFEKLCWKIERAKRPIFMSSKYTFTEDNYPLTLPKSQLDPSKNPNFPFLNYEVPENYKPNASFRERHQSWALLITRFGPLFNPTPPSVYSYRSVRKQHRQYVLYSTGQDPDAPLGTPNTLSQIFIPAGPDWEYDSQHRLIAVPFNAVPCPDDPLPLRGIPEDPPSKFRPDIQDEVSRKDFWLQQRQQYFRLQTMGWPRRYDILQQPVTTESLAIPTYYRIPLSARPPIKEQADSSVATIGSEQENQLWTTPRPPSTPQRW